MPNTLNEKTRVEHSPSLNAKRVVLIDPTDGGALGGSTSIPVTITGGAGSGGTSATDESTFTPATSAGTPIMGARDDVSPDTVAEDKLGIPRLTEYRAIHVNLRDATGSEVAVGGGTQYTEGDTDATITGTAILFESNTGTNALSAVSNSTPLPISDAGGVITIDGTVTANLSATDNAVLDSIDTSTQGILADTAAIQTAVETIDNAISGSEMQVDVVGALPAGTNLIGRVSASSETSTIYDGTTALTPKFAIIDAATSGDNTLVAAVTSKKIRVHALFVVSAGTVTARFESGAGGTALTGQMNLVANTGFVLPYNPVGWFETASNTLLNLELSGAISCDGSLVYTEV